MPLSPPPTERRRRPSGRITLQDVAREARAGVERLLTTVPLGEIARDGALVVIAGPPNAGKSSLFNALVKARDEGGLVFGGSLDGYNSYAQRGNLATVEHVAEAGKAMPSHSTNPKINARMWPPRQTQNISLARLAR